MSTTAPSVLTRAADDWENLPEYPSAVCSGIVGDAQHQAQGGYHISYNNNPSGNYSIVRPDDKPPNLPSANKGYASAIDMSMSTADMKKSYKNWKRLYDDHSDPRRKYFNAVNCWSGSGDARRLDFYANTNSTATNDHQWHEHVEARRKYCNDDIFRRAYLSVGKGETKEQWIAKEENDVGQVEGFTKEGFKDMMKTDDAIPNLPWRSDYLKFDAPEGATGPNGGTNRFIMWETWFDSVGQYLFDNAKLADQRNAELKAEIEELKAMITGEVEVAAVVEVSEASQQAIAEKTADEIRNDPERDGN